MLEYTGDDIVGNAGKLNSGANACGYPFQVVGEASFDFLIMESVDCGVN